MRCWNRTAALRLILCVAAAPLVGCAPPSSSAPGFSATKPQIKTAAKRPSPNTGQGTQQNGPAFDRPTTRSPLPERNQSREWAFAEGRSRITGAFISCEDGTVHLRKADGKNVEIQFEKLAISDQVFILRDALPRIDSSATLLVGRVVGITDGDTITVLDFDKTTSKVRLDGIDAPEFSQDFGTQAKKALSEKAFGKYARVEWKEKDRYKRTLGHVYVDSRDINKELVEEGFAWHYKQYSRDKKLAAAEERARESKCGLWSMSKPVAPWDFRHKPTSILEDKPATPPTEGKAAGLGVPAEIIVYVTKNGEKYHGEGCRFLSKSKIPIVLSKAKEQYWACSVCKPPQ